MYRDEMPPIRDAMRGQLSPKVRQYVAETFGKAEIYWNAWCEDVAAVYGRTPQQISELHLAILPRDFVPF